MPFAKNPLEVIVLEVAVKFVAFSSGSVIVSVAVSSGNVRVEVEVVVVVGFGLGGQYTVNSYLDLASQVRSPMPSS